MADELARALADRASGLVFDAGSITVGGYLDRWLEDSDRGSVRTSTYERHREIVGLHIRPALGHVKLSKLTPAHVQGLYREKLDSGLSAATVQKIHAVLHKALAQALKWNMIARNVTDAVKAPRPPKRCARFPQMRRASSSTPRAVTSWKRSISWLCTPA